MKLVYVVLILVLGAVITGSIDTFLGIDFGDIGAPARIAHAIVYMVWGAAIGALINSC